MSLREPNQERNRNIGIPIVDTLRFDLSRVLAWCKYNFADFVVLMICSGIVFGLIAYIVDDLFLTLKQELSANSKRRALLLLCVCASGPLGPAWLKGWAKISSSEYGVSSLAHFGISRELLSSYRRFQLILFWLFSGILLWFGYIATVAIGLFAWDRAIIGATVLASLGLSWWIECKYTANEERGSVSLGFSAPWQWRLRQIGNHQGSLVAPLALSLIGYSAFAFGAYREWPIFLLSLAAFLASLGWLQLLCIDAARTIQWSWIEKASGMSHQGFVKIYLQLSLIFTGCHMVILILLALAIHPKLWDFHQVILCLSASSSSILIFPSLMFQLDVKRAALQFMIVFLVALFLFTAIFAHLASVLLVIATYFYAAKYQINRYYRAAS
jgi:hypothetical protein